MQVNPTWKQAFIGFGSNLGDGRENILEAWSRLGVLPGVETEKLSAPYMTAPIGMVSDNIFTNAVGRITTTLSCGELLDNLLRLEKSLGRDRAGGPDRTIDLDLLYYDETVLSIEGLSVPHPEIQNRLFVLLPMNELAPELIHPVLKRSTADMLARILSEGQAAEKASWQY